MPGRSGTRGGEVVAGRGGEGVQKHVRRDDS